MVSNLSLDSLLDPVVEIAREAGQAVLEIYAGGNFQTTYKADKSPLTQADLAANDIIIKRLHSLTPSIPIISEESLDIETSNRQTSAVIWLVDPLDGTKEFINKNGEFTVNIGLIQAGVPVLGVVYAPAHQLLYYGARHIGAWKQI
ncbi:MAG TPA: 3'(2'),5'-bisphosphate nucleotidase CysQ, partial [Candidatus Saccharimonadales bacterium]|nr:3'(2'),5'-bisphosphate nucleotidase CysQ [Candidatus Saccharimonadales bacterium]